MGTSLLKKSHRAHHVGDILHANKAAQPKEGRRPVRLAPAITKAPGCEATKNKAKGRRPGYKIVTQAICEADYRLDNQNKSYDLAHDPHTLRK